LLAKHLPAGPTYAAVRTPIVEGAGTPASPTAASAGRLRRRCALPAACTQQAAGDANRQVGPGHSRGQQPGLLPVESKLNRLAQQTPCPPAGGATAALGDAVVEAGSPERRGNVVRLRTEPGGSRDWTLADLEACGSFGG
jgi:hypothetical protein